MVLHAPGPPALPVATLPGAPFDPATAAPATGGDAASAGSSLVRSPRIALYSHDSVGLGHIRRNLGLARAFARLAPEPNLVLVAGSSDAGALTLPPRSDLVTLPALHKGTDGAYRSRRLDLGLADLVGLRSAIAAAALGAFSPDLLVVDRHARGFRGELEPALDLLRSRGTRIVLGIRDVIDEPDRVRKEWSAARTDEALARWYDEVWTYTDAAVHDPLAALAGTRPVPVRPTGYLVPPVDECTEASEAGAVWSRLRREAEGDPAWILATVGGGSDGGALARAVASAPLPDGADVVVLCGPQMPQGDRAALAAIRGRNPRVHVVASVPDPWPLLRGAAAIISMTGYNSACETLSLPTPTLYVPRVEPRREQLIRASAFAERGIADLLEPADATPGRIGAWIADALARPPVDRSAVGRNGLAVASAHAARLLGAVAP